MHVSAASLRTLGSIVGFSLLAACSGAGQSSVAQGSGVLPSTQQAMASHIETGGASPDTCKGTGGVLVLPCKLTFNNSQTQTVTVSPFGASYQLPTEKGCKGYATFQYFDYGMFNVSPGSTKGKCRAVFTVKTSSGQLVGHAYLHVTNNY